MNKFGILVVFCIVSFSIHRLLLSPGRNQECSVTKILNVGYSVDCSYTNRNDLPELPEEVVENLVALQLHGSSITSVSIKMFEKFKDTLKVLSLGNIKFPCNCSISMLWKDYLGIEKVLPRNLIGFHKMTNVHAIGLGLPQNFPEMTCFDEAERTWKFFHEIDLWHCKREFIVQVVDWTPWFFRTPWEVLNNDLGLRDPIRQRMSPADIKPNFADTIFDEYNSRHDSSLPETSNVKNNSSGVNPWKIIIAVYLFIIILEQTAKIISGNENNHGCKIKENRIELEEKITKKSQQRKVKHSSLKSKSGQGSQVLISKIAPSQQCVITTNEPRVKTSTKKELKREILSASFQTNKHSKNNLSSKTKATSANRSYSQIRSETENRRTLIGCPWLQKMLLVIYKPKATDRPILSQAVKEIKNTKFLSKNPLLRGERFYNIKLKGLNTLTSVHSTVNSARYGNLRHIPKRHGVLLQRLPRNESFQAY